MDRMTLPDKELTKSSLFKLSLTAHNQDRSGLLTSLIAIDAFILKFISVNDVKESFISKVKSRVHALSKYARVRPTNTFSLEGDSSTPIPLVTKFEPRSIEELVLEDAHARAEARYRKRVRSRIGKTHIRRKANEIWAERSASPRLIGGSASSDITAKDIARVFSSSAFSTGIDMRDFPLIEKILGIRVRTVQDKENVREALDEHNSGHIDPSRLSAWVSSGMYLRHKSYIRQFRNYLYYRWLKSTGGWEAFLARLDMLVGIRHLSRLESELPHCKMEKLIPIAGKMTSYPDVVEARYGLEQELSLYLSAVKAVDERAELSLLYRLAADDAEWNCRWNFLTRAGQYLLSTESLLVDASRDMAVAYSSCMPESIPFPRPAVKLLRSVSTAGFDGIERSSSVALISAKVEYQQGKAYDLAWAVILEPIILSFDTDCTGSFDEDETKLLLQCVKKPLPERKLLFEFPEVLTSSASLEKVRDFLVKNVKWLRLSSKSDLADSYRMGRGRGQITVDIKGVRQSSSMLLVSLCRQTAKELSLAATTLTSYSQLSESDDSANEYALFVRCQMLAMRQVVMLLNTPLGRVQRETVRGTLKEIWGYLVDESDEVNRYSIIQYAFRLHSCRKGMLITEWPHLIRYLTIGWNFKPTERMHILTQFVSTVRGRKDLKWFTESDVVNVLSTDILLSPPSDGTALEKEQTKRRLNWRREKDAEMHMLSVARQQALLIALKVRHVRVHESNHRCYVLGLDRVIRSLAENQKWKLFRSEEDDDLPKELPKEILPVFLLSKGVPASAFYNTSLTPFLSLYSFKKGQLDTRAVPIDELLEEADTHIHFSKYNIINKFMKSAVILKNKHYDVYSRLAVKALQMHRRDVDIYGGEFLSEILSGTSHCVKKLELTT